MFFSKANSTLTTIIIGRALRIIGEITHLVFVSLCVTYATTWMYGMKFDSYLYIAVVKSR